MPRNSRLLLCRLGFLLLCLLPTLIVCGWTISRSWRGGAARAALLAVAPPAASRLAPKAEWERELTSGLGLVVEIGKVGYPGPQIARLDDVRLTNAETRRVIGIARTIEVTKTAAGWLARFSQVQLELAEAGLLARRIDDRLLRGPLAAGTTVEWGPLEITLVGNGRRQTLRVSGGRYAASEEAAELALAFQLPEAATPAAAGRLHVVRRRGSAPTTTWKLETGGAPLSCNLAAGWLPELSCLGEGCRFAGQATVVESAAGYSGTLSGDFLDVDLDTLVSERFPHRLSGLARLRVEKALLDHGKLFELRGTLQATSGSISSSLVAAAGEHLQLNVLPTGDAAAGAAIPFNKLSLAFDLNRDFLSLSASGDSQAARVLLAGPAGPMLQAPPAHAVPAVNLLRTLLPARQYQVPATRQTAALVGLLPVPDLAAPADSHPTDSHTPTRLAPAAAAASGASVRQPEVR